MGSALDDHRVANRLTAPLGDGVLVRLQRISAGKSPEGNYALEVDDRGRIRLAHHTGAGSAWRTPLDVPLPETATGRAGPLVLRKLRKLVASTEVPTSPMVVTGSPAKDGVFEIVTVPPDRQVVYDGVDNELLQVLRKLAGAA